MQPQLETVAQRQFVHRLHYYAEIIAQHFAECFVNLRCLSLAEKPLASLAFESHHRNIAQGKPAEAVP
jgi:hypothetical protein